MNVAIEDRQFAETDSNAASNNLPLRSGLFLCTLFIGLTFFLYSEHSFSFLDRNTQQMSEEDIAEEHIERGEGSMMRKLILLGFAAFASALVFTSSPARPFHPWRFGACFFLGWLALCFGSVLWSIDPGTTLKRTVAMFLFAWTAFGFTWRFTSRDLFRFVTFISICFVGFSFVAEIAGGSFRPWESWYRFAGTVHPNMQATYCALVCFAGYCLFLERKTKSMGRMLLAAMLFFGGFSFLLATKSRMSLGAVLIVLTVLPALYAKPPIFYAALFFSCSGLLALILMFSTSGTAVIDAIAPSRATEDQPASSLNGRVPLWISLFEHLDDAALVGYGYAAFWTPGTIEDFKEEQEWSMQSAHSAYIETLLAVGYAGGLLLLLATISATIRCGAIARSNLQVGYLFFFAILLYSMLQGLLESHAVGVLFAGFVNVIAVSLALFYEPELSDEEEAASRGDAILEPS